MSQDNSMWMSAVRFSAEEDIFLFPPLRPDRLKVSFGLVYNGPLARDCSGRRVKFTTYFHLLLR